MSSSGFESSLRDKAVDDSQASDDRRSRRSQPAGVRNLVAAAHVQPGTLARLRSAAHARSRARRGASSPAEPGRHPHPRPRRRGRIRLSRRRSRRTDSARGRGCRTPDPGWRWRPQRRRWPSARPAGSASPTSHPLDQTQLLDDGDGSTGSGVTVGMPFSAVSGSLSPLPVTVHTTVDPWSTQPSSIDLSSPAMLAADAGSTNTPSVRATR